MRIWQVVPCARPYMVAQLVEQFRSQRYFDKRLCVVTSGPQWEGIDAARYFAEHEIPQPDLLIRGEPGKSAALGEAVEALRDQLLVVRDDDDLYTPDSLVDTARHVGRWDFAAQLRHWVQMDESLWLFNADDHSRELSDSRIWGGNFAFRASIDTPAFGTDPVRQCQQWARAMLEAGARGWQRSPDGAVMVRGYPDHLWKACPEMVHFCSGDALLAPADLRLVTGERAWAGEVLSRPPQTEAHHAQIEFMRADVDAIGYGG